MTTAPFDNNTDDRKTNVADLLKGADLIALMGKLSSIVSPSGGCLLKWDNERKLAMVPKRDLTASCESTPEAQAKRGWLTSQGFRGSRRSRSFYLTLGDLEARGVTIGEDGKAAVCEPKAPKAVVPNFDEANPFAV